MKKLSLYLLLVLVFGCTKEDMEQVRLEVDVSSGISYVSLEGYEVWLYGPESTLISTIDANGKAYFDFKAPLGESYVVEFQDNFENFTTQGIAATDWSPVLTSEKHSTQITVGQETKVELLAIPSADISIFIRNAVNEIGDSLFIVIRHELFYTELMFNENRSGGSLQYFGPMGHYEYEGTIYRANDTLPLIGSFDIKHNEVFYHEINY